MNNIPQVSTTSCEMHISFKLRKKNAMNKLSMAKSEHLVDVAMYDILDTLNAHPDLFTTSSCSGRIQLIAVPDVGRKHNYYATSLAS